MTLLDSLIEEDLLVSELAPVKEVFLAIRTDSAPGDGTRQNPFGCVSAQDFDRTLAEKTGANSIVRIGPGLFRTQGADSLATNPLNVFNGMRVVGSGIFNTVLRLSAVSTIGTSARSFAVIAGSGTVNNVEISDLTIDCDLGNQPITAGTPGSGYALMALQAIALVGRNNRIRRVRVINFGTRTPFLLNGVDQNGTGLPGSAEAFPFYILGEGAVVEDCIFEQPFLGTARETTLVSLNGPSSIARNNYIDCAFVNPPPGNATAEGIKMANVDQAIVEENLIDIGADPSNPDTTKAISRDAVNHIKTFNNRSTAGAFLACWNGTSHDGDPITDMEDSLLAL